MKKVTVVIEMTENEFLDAYTNGIAFYLDTLSDVCHAAKVIHSYKVETVPDTQK